MAPLILKLHSKRWVVNITSRPLYLQERTPVKVKVKVKVQFILEQATKPQRGSRGIAVLFL
jgi:hypothetical protein